MGREARGSAGVTDIDITRQVVEGITNARPPHEPTVDPTQAKGQRFEHVQFVGFISDFKQNRRGDIIIGITVPFRYRELVTGVLDAHMMPVNVDVIPWQQTPEPPPVNPEDVPIREV